MLAMVKADPVYSANHRNRAKRRNRAKLQLQCMLRCSLQATRTIGPPTFPKFALLLGFLFCCLGGPSSLVFANRATPKYDNRESDQVSELISRLDSRDYSQREKASEDLIEIGEQAIAPLAMRSFECSPEASWRIRKILERISTRGNETVFYKTTGILQLRYDSSNSEMEKRLSVLETKWKAQRKRNAISLLRKKGAVIDDPYEGVQELVGQQPGQQIFLGGPPSVVLINGQLVVSSEQVTSSGRKPKKRLSDSDAKKEIERILSSDLEQVRKIVIGDRLKKSKLNEQTDPEFVELQRQIIARGHFIGGPGGSINGQGVSVELGERWKGAAADLESLTDLTKLTEIKLVDQNLNASYLKRIGEIKTINRLVIENCEFSTKLENSKWPETLKEIELADLDLSNELLASVKEIPSLTQLTFRQCDFELTNGVEELTQMKSLRGLQFKGLDIPTKLFKSFAGMRQLSYINLSYCKFKTKDYKAFKKLRPNLQISFTAKAFLGVRGPMDMLRSNQSISGCLVSDVIARSGAEKGGIEVNDVIETINGEKIEVFEDLRLHIAQHRPGDTLEVTVQRQGKSVDLKIELSSFEQASPR